MIPQKILSYQFLIVRSFRYLHTFYNSNCMDLPIKPPLPVGGYLPVHPARKNPDQRQVRLQAKAPKIRITYPLEAIWLKRLHNRLATR